tara:strand:- start:104 stop:229 length:126 start_codon:yes stop_codon:yes gene_type:complete
MDFIFVTTASAFPDGSRRKFNAAFVADNAAIPHFDGVKDVT